MDNPLRKERRRFRSLYNLGVLGVVVLFVVVTFFFNSDTTTRNLPYGKFKAMLQDPQVTFQNVVVGPKDFHGEVTVEEPVEEGGSRPDKFSFHTSRVGINQDDELLTLLAKKFPNYTALPEDSPLKTASQYVFLALLAIATLLLAVFAMKSITGSGGNPFSVSRRHKLYRKADLPPITFDHVAGIDEAKGELEEVVNFLQNKAEYEAIGAAHSAWRAPRRAAGYRENTLGAERGRTGRRPLHQHQRQRFRRTLRGRRCFARRRAVQGGESHAPCIVFIDELDALGRSRSSSGFMNHEEREQTLNQLLVQMDGFDTKSGVIVMAATNRPEILDPALLRRFDRMVVVDRPDVKGRKAILEVHTEQLREKHQLSCDVDLDKIAALTPGSVGADLASLVNEAALLAARDSMKSARKRIEAESKEAIALSTVNCAPVQQIEMRHFEEAVERGAVGLERRSKIMSKSEKRRVAFHEAGHAMVASARENSDPVHKVSIIPRGMTGGYVLQRPNEDRLLMTRGELETRIKVALGGTIAEELALSDISTGATNDLQTATDIAMRMVREFGMSRLGRIYLGPQEPGAFLPTNAGEGGTPCSEQTAREIDLEVRQILENCLEEVRGILRGGRCALDALAEVLIFEEVISSDRLEQILQENHLPSEAYTPKVARFVPLSIRLSLLHDLSGGTSMMRVDGSIT